MSEDVRTFEFTIEGTTPYLPHKFSGQKEDREIKALSDKEQAEAHAYRDENGMLCIPNNHIRGALINAFINRAVKNTKMSTKERVSPKINIEPFMLSLGKKTFTIDKRVVRVEQGKKSVTDFCVRPLIEKWETSGRLIASLDDDMKRWLEEAGKNSGVGSNRINGYGRFKVTSFKEVTPK